MEVNNEHVIRGNNALLRCNVPAFIVDFVSIALWMDSEGESFSFDSPTLGLCYSIDLNENQICRVRQLSH